MPNENLKRMLDISKKMEEQTSNNSNTKNVTAPRTRMTEQQLDKQIDIWNEQVFGESKPTEGYDPMAELEKIKNRRNEGATMVVNNPILQEVINNPYELDVDVITGAADPKRQEFEKVLEKKYKGINNAVKINETIEKKDKEKIEEKKRQTINTAIDYDQLKEMIESIIDNKLNEIKTTLLTESRTNNANTLSMLMIRDNFTFVDDKGIIYEFTGLKRKGKAKINY